MVLIYGRAMAEQEADNAAYGLDGVPTCCDAMLQYVKLIRSIVRILVNEL